MAMDIERLLILADFVETVPDHLTMTGFIEHAPNAWARWT